jgi:DoxX-like family
VFIALAITTALLALILVNSAVMKLRRHEQVLAVIHGTVGVPQRFLPVLAALEIAGAVGIVAGLWSEALGILAAAALVAYFLGAVIGHLRVRDTKNLMMPLPPLALSIAVLVLRIATA